MDLSQKIRGAVASIFLATGAAQAADGQGITCDDYIEATKFHAQMAVDAFNASIKGESYQGPSPEESMNTMQGLMDESIENGTCTPADYERAVHPE